MLFGGTLRTFPCPRCAEIITTGVVRCDYCSAPIDPDLAEAAADEQQKLQRAFAVANNLVITARMILAAFILCATYFLFLLGAVGLVLLLVWIPVGAIRWSISYGKLGSPHPDYVKARRLVYQAVLIWGGAILAIVLWYMLSFGPLHQG